MRKLLILFILLFATNAFATNITFKEGDGKGDPSETHDTYFNSGGAQPSLGWLTVGNNGTLNRAIVGFPNFLGSGANQVPEGVKVTDAKLRLRLNGTSTGTVGINIHRILQQWDHSTTTGYYGIPGYHFRKSGIQWSNLFVNTPTSRTSTITDSLEVATTTGVFYDFDVTDDIQSIAMSVINNYGYLIKTDTEVNGEYKLFTSSEATSSQRPILDITYQTIDVSDTTPPVLSNGDPSGALASHTLATTMSLNTSEDAYCKYSTSASTTFNDMSGTFLTSWSLTHSVNITGLSDGSSYNYYVRCSDANTNKNNSDYQISFSVGADSTPPGDVVDLAVTSCTSNSCSIAWTAMGDDGSTLDAETIDIRYSTSAITAGNWGSAARFIDETTPLSPGTTERYTIDALAPATTYYFAVKTSDVAGNTSGLSNVPNSTTDAISASTTINVWNNGLDVKIRPPMVVGTTKTASYNMAQNEWGAIQIGVTTTQQQLDNVNVSIDITGISNTLVYYVGNMHVITVSSINGDTGEWADVMYPKVDSYYGETRNIFPMTLRNTSRAYPFISGTGKYSYGEGLGDANGQAECGHPEGCWQMDVDPPSGFVYPYNGTQTSAGNDASNYNKGNGEVTVGGVYYGEENFKRYYIIIESTGATDATTFKWSDDGGETFVTGVTASSTPTVLSSGITVAFSGSNLRANDEWVIYAGKDYTHAFWLEFKTANDLPAGDYSGTITVSADGMTTFEMPVSIHVWDFALPDTARLPSHFENFGSSMYGGAFQQGHPDVVAADMIENVYIAAGLNHKISMSTIGYNNNGSFPSCTCTSYNESTREITMNCSNFDKYYGQFLDGDGVTDQPPGIPFSGTLTTFVKRGYTSYSGSIIMNNGSCSFTNSSNFLKDQWKGFLQVFRDNGWFDKFYVWTKDEPKYSAGWNESAGVYTHWKSIGSDVRTFVTNDVCEAETFGVEDSIDIFIPQPSWGDRPLGSEWDSISNPRCAKAEYDAWKAEVPGREVWSYHACNEKGGCGLHGAFFLSNWANYAVDEPKVSAARMRMWYDRHRNYTGELYYSTNQGHYRYVQRNVNPFDTTFWYGANGDGMLFYPGWASEIGGTNDIPIESLRLKAIRLGMQDYDYFALTDDIGESAFVDSLLDQHVISATEIQPTAEEIETVRENLANKILNSYIYYPNRGVSTGSDISGGTIK